MRQFVEASGWAHGRAGLDIWDTQTPVTLSTLANHPSHLMPNSGDLLPDLLLAVSKQLLKSYRFQQYRKLLDPLRTTFHDQASVAMFRSINQILGTKFHRDRLNEVVYSALNTTLKGMPPPHSLVTVTTEAYQLFAGSKPLLYHHNFPFLRQPWPQPSVYVTIVEPPSHYTAKMVYHHPGVANCMSGALGRPSYDPWKYDPEGNLTDPNGTLAPQLKLLVDRCLPVNSLTRMFCGRAKVCGPLYAASIAANQADAFVKEFEEAVTQAKHVISDHYLFVGTSERIDDSLRILALLLPTFFKINLDELYKSRACTPRHPNVWPSLLRPPALSAAAAAPDVSAS